MSAGGRGRGASGLDGRDSRHRSQVGKRGGSGTAARVCGRVGIGQPWEWGLVILTTFGLCRERDDPRPPRPPSEDLILPPAPLFLKEST